MSACQTSLFTELAATTRGPLAHVDMTEKDEMVVNHSGGKDSMCIAEVTVREAERQGVLDRVIFQYNDLGPRVTWPGTAALGQHLVDQFGDRLGSKELVEAAAKHYGVRFRVTRRDGGDLLDDIERRGKFPDAARRWCTSDFKRAPGLKLLTELVRGLNLTRKAQLLYVFGFRAQESEGRRRKVAEPLVLNTTASNQTKREVWDWYPIHDWSEADVWESIKASGLEYHWAYDAGMTRLSCSFCVLASKADLLRAAWLRPDVALQYLWVEEKTGHKFRQDLSMADILAASQAEYGWELAA